MIKHRSQLPQLLKDLKLPLVAAELGVAEGYLSNDFLEGGLERLYMVDAWATLMGPGDGANSQAWHDSNMKNALARVSKHGEKAVILRGLTEDMAYLVPDGSLGMLYLDAGHLYHEVMNDLRAWEKKVINGGIIAFHDYLAPQYGVYQAVNDYANKYKYKVFEIPENKSEDAGAWFRVETSSGL
jgi:hypothetical protein